MEYVGTVLSAAQNLLDALQRPELNELCSVWGYESELEELERTVNTIEAVLRDADSKQLKSGLSNQAQLWVDELKDAVYDADDLLDKYVTIAEQKQQRAVDGEGDPPLMKKVRQFFSFENPFLVALNMYQEIKKIRSKLDAIADVHNRFGFKLDYQPIRRRREETCSYVYAPNIFGRENDLEKIVATLLDADSVQDVSFLTIVGIGGLGKTALAQLVFNDPRIEQEFPLRLWTCVSDHDEECLDIKAILLKVVHSVTHHKHEYVDLEHIQRELRGKLRGKKYLLVLDDVWNEDRHQWLKLIEFLTCGLKGSWIMVTTRSRMTAEAVAGGPIYDLKGLSEEDSWRLFESTAFGHGFEGGNPTDLVQVGRDIVKKCANVPLAIKVAGSLLYGQDKEKWLSFREFGLGRVRRGENDGIKHILKLSYDNLEPPLKICFSYCAIFPKDFVIKKKELIDLWIAQGYIASLEGPSVDDAGEEYFSVLLRRCFFQDVIKDEFGEIVSCKIHDLMHDIAQEVAGREIYVTNSISSNLHKRVRHLCHRRSNEQTECSFTRAKSRTYLQVDRLVMVNPLPVDKLLENWMWLRALDLSCSGIKSLPNILGKLLHLRYLDLSGNQELEMLPKCITDLHNLQTLNLNGCSRLKELPKDLRRLVKLRVLDATECRKLIDMPCGIGKLSFLRKLPLFVVGVNTATQKSVVDQLEDLKPLCNLEGRLCIRIQIKNLGDNVLALENVRGGGYTRNKQHLNHIEIEFDSEAENSRIADYEEELIEGLQPHPNVRKLELTEYMGKMLPSWAREANLATSLPNLVCICLVGCYALEHVALLRALRYLKSLQIAFLNKLEYIEDAPSRPNVVGDDGGVSESEPFFPSLKELTLRDLPNLKGWWRENPMMDCNRDTKQQHILLPPFPLLYSLIIENCSHLTSIPPCPAMEQLQVKGFYDKHLRIRTTDETGHTRLRKIRTNNVECLKLILSKEAFQCLERMEIDDDQEVESFVQVGELFQSCSSSLRSLSIWDCGKLKSLWGGLKHLTVLEELELQFLPELMTVDGIPWHCLQYNLRSLTLNSISKLVKLPEEMGCFTSLQSLYIGNCQRLESIPKSIQNLTSLKRLNVEFCSLGLTERCENPNGEDWPNIQHIPQLTILY